MLPLIGLVLLLAVLNGFFSLSEIAVVASRKSLLKHRARHSARARLALELVERPERVLSTVQVGITLISIVAGVATGASIGARLGVWLEQLGWDRLTAYALPIGLFLSVALITFLNIVVGELVPKRAALVAPEKVATLVAVPMLMIARIIGPFVWVLNSVSTLILKALHLHGKRSGLISEEEIRLMVAESAEQGVLDSDERNMVNRVLRLGDRSVDSVMTPRTRIAWLDANAELQQNLAVLRSTPFSRYPVYRGDESEIIGILEVKSLVEDIARHHVDLFRKLAKPVYIPATARALDLFEEFREAESALAMVVDEYGGIEGIVTINDLLGAVVGRTTASHDERGARNAAVVQRADGSYLIDGALSCDDLMELLGEDELPHQDEHEFHTVAGMMMAEFGRIPDTGQHFSWHDHYFEVVDLDGARIDKILMMPAQTHSPLPTED